MSERESWIGRKKYCDLSPGRRLAYVERVSEGPLALLIHGFTDSSRSFSLIEQSLTGLSLVMPDLAGHGHSTTSNSDYEIDTLAQHVASLMRELGKKPDIIVGHSLGALIALRLAAGEYQGIAHLVLLSGSVNPSMGVHPQLCEWISTISDPIDPKAPFFDYWYESGASVPSSYIDNLRIEAAAVRTDVWRKLFSTLQSCNLTRDAETLTTPTLTIAGTDDRIFDTQHRQILCQALRNHTQVLLNDVGHNPHWERPEEVASLILEFVSEKTQGQKYI